MAEEKKEEPWVLSEYHREMCKKIGDAYYQIKVKGIGSSINNILTSINRPDLPLAKATRDLAIQDHKIEGVCPEHSDICLLEALRDIGHENLKFIEEADLYFGAVPERKFRRLARKLSREDKECVEEARRIIINFHTTKTFQKLKNAIDAADRYLKGQPDPLPTEEEELDDLFRIPDDPYLVEQEIHNDDSDDDYNNDYNDN